MKRRTYFFLSGCLLFKYLHFLKNKNNIKTTYNSYTLGHNQEKYAAETIQGLQLKTMQGYINTAATQLYSIFCSLFFSFLFLYTTRKGWFIFLACLKNCLQKKKGYKREARLDFVDERTTSTIEKTRVRKRTIRRHQAFVFSSHACVVHMYKKRQQMIIQVFSPTCP